MSDTPEAIPADTRSDSEEIALQIGRSLGSIWERRDGARPDSVATDFEVNVVRCVIEPGPTPKDGERIDGSTDSSAYRHEAIEMVSRLTRRRVTAMIAKSDTKTGVARNTFTLERAHMRF